MYPGILQKHPRVYEDMDVGYSYEDMDVGYSELLNLYKHSYDSQIGLYCESKTGDGGICILVPRFTKIVLPN